MIWLKYKDNDNNNWSRFQLEASTSWNCFETYESFGMSCSGRYPMILTSTCLGRRGSRSTWPRAMLTACFRVSSPNTRSTSPNHQSINRSIDQSINQSNKHISLKRFPVKSLPLNTARTAAYGNTPQYFTPKPIVYKYGANDHMQKLSLVQTVLLLGDWK